MLKQPKMTNPQHQYSSVTNISYFLQVNDVLDHIYILHHSTIQIKMEYVYQIKEQSKSGQSCN